MQYNTRNNKCLTNSQMRNKESGELDMDVKFVSWDTGEDMK